MNPLYSQYINAVKTAEELIDQLRGQPDLQAKVATIGNAVEDLANTNSNIAVARAELAQLRSEQKAVAQAMRQQESKRQAIAQFSDPRYIRAGNLRSDMEAKRCTRQTLEDAIEQERGLYAADQVRSDLYQILEEPSYQADPNKALANLYNYYYGQRDGGAMLVAHDILKKYCLAGLTE